MGVAHSRPAFQRHALLHFHMVSCVARNPIQVPDTQYDSSHSTILQIASLYDKKDFLHIVVLHVTTAQ